MMSRTEWVYTYDEHGNRTGLIEQEIVSAKSAGITDWYIDIEEEVISREAWKSYPTSITPFERDLQRAELKCLRDTRYKAFSTRVKTLQSIRFTNSGLKVTDDIDVITQDEPYIMRFIQKELGSRGMVVSMTQVRGMLQDISDVYISADKHDVPVTLTIAKHTRQRLRNTLRKVS